MDAGGNLNDVAGLSLNQLCLQVFFEAQRGRLISGRA